APSHGESVHSPRDGVKSFARLGAAACRPRERVTVVPAGAWPGAARGLAGCGARCSTRMEAQGVWQQQGKRAAAYELATPIYGWFTEGFDTADLQEAKALMEALEGEHG